MSRLSYLILSKPRICCIRVFAWVTSISSGKAYLKTIHRSEGRGYCEAVR